jgi:pyruvate/2-oxoglutarate dehydrogenase complex dihydrolipoamide dehydrogenase (E3) component
VPLSFKFDDLDRGRTDAPPAEPDAGFVELLVDPSSSLVLGATIVGKDAGEQLAPVVLLMNQKIGLKALGSLVLPYPTRSEYLRRLADAWNRTRLTPRTAKLLAWWVRRSL